MMTKIKTRDTKCDGQIAKVDNALGNNVFHLKTTVLASIVELRTARHARKEKKHAELMQEILQNLMQHSLQHMQMGKIEKSADAQNDIEGKK